MSWIVAAAALTLALNSLGVNVLPLLTLGGASTIVVGLASQQLLANALNGVSIVSVKGGGRGSGRPPTARLL
jgi:small-conductance mechanosensitive channel